MANRGTFLEKMKFPKFAVYFLKKLLYNIIVDAKHSSHSQSGIHDIRSRLARPPC